MSYHFSQSRNAPLKSQPARVDQETVFRWHRLFDHPLWTPTNEPCTSRELIADCLFGEIADKRKFLKDEADERLTEIYTETAAVSRGHSTWWATDGRCLSSVS